MYPMLPLYGFVKQQFDKEYSTGVSKYSVRMAQLPQVLKLRRNFQKQFDAGTRKMALSKRKNYPLKA